jgi:uncharacterized membrane protein YkvA (DUF1232 family)
MDKGKLGQEFISKESQKVTDKDLATVVNRSGDIEKKFVSGGPLHRFVEDGQLLLKVVRDYWTGRYRQLPFGTIAAVAFTLIYVLDPFDLVPDFLPIIGQVDDAAVVAACLLLVERDLRSYAQWAAQQALKPPTPQELPPPPA